MTREEQIERTSLSYSCVGSAIDFEAGAKWADDNPKEGLVDLSQVWHNAKEEPEKGKVIISIDEDDGVSIDKWTGKDKDWVSFAEWYNIIRWAYVSDLIPKSYINLPTLGTII